MLCVINIRNGWLILLSDCHLMAM